MIGIVLLSRHRSANYKSVTELSLPFAKASADKAGVCWALDGQVQEMTHLQCLNKGAKVQEVSGFTNDISLSMSDSTAKS